MKDVSKSPAPEIDAKPPALVARVVQALQLARRYPSLACLVVVWAAWLTLVIRAGIDLGALYSAEWPIALTMIFGSFIAGATSEGGGAVAFPVLTLVLGTDPASARDFSLMIQSVGMSAAAITILALRIPVAKGAILFDSLGGAVGIVFGLEFVAPLLPPPYIKTFFTSCWLSFGVALLLINSARRHAAKLRRTLPLTASGRLALVGIGFLGGIVSGVTGSGLDLLIFSVVVLLFRLNETVATPTSVILMAVNALVGFAWKGFGFSEMPLSAEAWDYWLACVPVVVVGAPLGAVFISRCSRSVVVGLLFTSIAVQYVAALLLIPQTVLLVAFNLSVFAAGASLFLFLGHLGAGRQADCKARVPQARTGDRFPQRSGL